MSLLTKLTIAAFTTIAGGGTAMGFFSKADATSNSETPPQQQELRTSLEVEVPKAPAEEASSGVSSPSTKVQADDSSSKLEVPTSDPLTQEEESAHVKKQTLPVKNLNGEGNCLVEDGWADIVIKHLPTGTKYVTVLCTNSGDFDATLTKWRGFLPEGLFLSSIDLYVRGDRFDIKVKEESVTGSYAEDDLEAPTNQAVFSSDQFVSPSYFTGRWGSKTLLEVTGTEDPVYEASLTGSESVNKFYFQWLL